MYIDGIITDQQKHGILLCIPKNSDPERIEDYRPLTLLNSDYKLLTRIIANIMRPWMTDIIQKVSVVDHMETRYSMLPRWYGM